MDDRHDPLALLSDALGENLLFATASERLRCGIISMKLPLELIREIAEAEPELKPELIACVEHIGEATEALVRAHRFLTARLEVRTAEIIAGRRPPTEGDNPT